MILWCFIQFPTKSIIMWASWYNMRSIPGLERMTSVSRAALASRSPSTIRWYSAFNLSASWSLILGWKMKITLEKRNCMYRAMRRIMKMKLVWAVHSQITDWFKYRYLMGKLAFISTHILHLKLTSFESMCKQVYLWTDVLSLSMFCSHLSNVFLVIVMLIDSIQTLSVFENKTVTSERLAIR